MMNEKKNYISFEKGRLLVVIRNVSNLNGIELTRE